MKKIYKIYLFGDLVFKSNNILIIEAYKNTFKEDLKKYIIIK